MPAGLGYEELGDLSDPKQMGLLTGIEYSRVRDSAWMYLTSFVTIRTGIGLVVVQGNYLTQLR